MNSLDVRKNKQIGWKKGWQQADDTFIFRCGGQKTSVHAQEGDGDANLLVNTESSKSCKSFLLRPRQRPHHLDTSSQS